MPLYSSVRRMTRHFLFLFSLWCILSFSTVRFFTPFSSSLLNKMFFFHSMSFSLWRARVSTWSLMFVFFFLLDYRKCLFFFFPFSLFGEYLVQIQTLKHTYTHKRMSHLVPGKKKVTNGREAFKGVFGKRVRNGGLPGRHCSTGKHKTKKKKKAIETVMKGT